MSQVGTWMFGFIPEIHKPQVWVERADADGARPVLDGYESRTAERQNASAEGVTAGPPIEAVCEECGGRTTFAPAQRGSVQGCPHCGAYIDVGGEEMPEDWPEAQDGEEAVEEP